MSVPVFISSAAANRGERDQVIGHLQPLVNRGLIQLLESPEAGAIAEEETEALLAQAQIVLLLVTSQYFDSPSFKRDWRSVVERHGKGLAKIRPLLLTPVLWHGQKIGDLSFEILKPLPEDQSFVFDNGRSAQKLRDIAASIQSQAEKLSPPAIVRRPVAASLDPIDQALDTVSRSLSRSNIVLFIGSSGAPLAGRTPPRPVEVTKELLGRLQLIGDEYNQLLPPMDVVAALYAASTSPSSLANAIDEIYGPRSDVPTLQTQLASLLKGVTEQRRKNKSVIDEPQIVVTSALDVSLEAALLAEGLSFSRIVQHWSADKVTVNQYAEVSVGARHGTEVLWSTGIQPGDAKPWEIGAADRAALARLITNCGRFDVNYDDRTPRIGEGLQGDLQIHEEDHVRRHTSSNALAELNVRKLQQPVLYKVRGSLDLRNSVALSTDQYIELVLKAIVWHRVPKEIAQQVANSIVLFLGSGVLDPEFRLMYGLFREQIIKGHAENYERYMVQLPPAQDLADSYRQMEQKFWSSLKKFAIEHRKVDALDIAPDKFLERLTANFPVV